MSAEPKPILRSDSRFFAAKRRMLIACVLAYTVSYLCRTNLSLALNDMARTVGVSRSAVGAWSTGYFWVYAAGQLLCGWLCTRYSAKKILSLGLLLTAACNLGVSFSHSYWQILILWMCNGLALSMFWPPIVQLSSQWIEREDYVRVSILLNLPTTIGYMLGWGILGALQAFTSWHMVFRAPAVLALCFFVWWQYTVPESPEAAGFCSSDIRSEPQANRGKAKGCGLKGILCTGSMIAFAIVVLAHGSTKESINLWAPTLLSDAGTGSSALMLSSFTALIPVFSTCGLLLTGWSLRRLHGGQNRILLLLVLGGALCAWALALFHTSTLLILVFLGLLLGILYGSATILTTLVPLRFAYTGRVAQISGLFNFTAYLGAALGGVLSGWVCDKWGWPSVYLLWAVLNTLALAVLFLSEWWRSR